VHNSLAKWSSMKNYTGFVISVVLKEFLSGWLNNLLQTEILLKNRINFSNAGSAAIFNEQMITFSLSNTEYDLLDILDLQKRNLAQNLSADEIISQGFVTVSHTKENLIKMNSYEKSVLIKEDNNLIGYILAMTSNSRKDIPILFPMFEVFDNVLYKGQVISRYNYLIIGQVCIDKKYRGTGLLDQGYEFYRTQFAKKYDFAITEIAFTNQRSLSAHKRIGFTEIHKYTDKNKTDWRVVIWNW
jgi:hypothetical protein